LSPSTGLRSSSGEGSHFIHFVEGRREEIKEGRNEERYIILGPNFHDLI
jgi:hypothetical protein